MLDFNAWLAGYNVVLITDFIVFNVDEINGNFSVIGVNNNIPGETFISGTTGNTGTTTSSRS